MCDHLASCVTGDLVKELNSADVEKSETAVKKADAYLQSAEVTGFDRTLVNINNESFSDSKISVCFVRVFNIIITIKVFIWCQLIYVVGCFSH